MDTTTRNRIDDFAPRGWQDAVWRLARPAVIAAVQASNPHCADEAKGTASALCAFLAAPTGWDRVTSPAIDVLLTAAAITKHLSSDLGHLAQGTRYARKRRLNRVRVALEGGQFVTRGLVGARPPKPTAAVARTWATCPGASFVVLAAVHGGGTGAALTDARARGLIGYLARQNDANVNGGRLSTFTDDRAAVQAYLDAADVLSTEVITANAKPATRKSNFSRRAARDLDRKNRTAYARAIAGPELAPDPSLELLKPDVRAAVERYRPQNLEPATWRSVRDLVMRLVAGYQPPSKTTARNVCTIVVEFVLWVWNQPKRARQAAPTAAELLESDLVSAFISAITTQPRATRGTKRSTLRRCVRALEVHHVSVATGYESVRGPYTPAECALIAEVASHQKHDRMRRNACFLIGLTLGAGLSSNDMRHLHLRDIRRASTHEGESYLEVTAGTGAKRRVVPVRADYEHLVHVALELAASESKGTLVLGRAADRHNVTWTTVRQIATAVPGQRLDIDVQRLRTTWLFACMNAAVPVPALLHLAGLRSARTLTDLLAQCPPTDTEQVRVLVRHISDSTPISGGTR